jgi:glycosyltransferase involved in cell wall biosynthesis
MTATIGFVPLEACVVVPARDEEATVAACLAALAAQTGIDPAAYEVLLVLDACTDATEEMAAEAAAAHPWLRLRPLHGRGEGVGVARKLGMDLAARTLLAAGRTRGLIASTDADTVVAPDWLRTQLDLVAAGVDAIGGAIDLAEDLDAGVLRRRLERADGRMAAVRAVDPDAEHHHFSGASMALTAEAYMAVGGIEPLAALEDEALERRLRAAGIGVKRPAAVRVRTEPRLRGRAPRGLAGDLALDRWLHRRSYRADEFPLERLLACKRDTVSVILPAKECARTIGPILEHVLGLQAAGAVDEVLVVDAASRDGTAELARALGADVAQEDELLPEHGPARGKGDAMWRGLSATSGEIVVYIDADSSDVDASFALGAVGPLVCHPELALVKGAYHRPFRPDEGAPIPHGGGRVTELMARPLLNLRVPELAGFVQPLAGEIAARRPLLERLSFPVGYGVEIAMLIDALREVGLDAMGQVDLGERRNRHQSLRDLGLMAYAVLVAASRRLGDDVVPGPYALPSGEEIDVRPVAVEERPPLGARSASSRTAYEPRG